MKRILLTTYLLFLLFECYAQETTLTSKLASQFVKYYNTSQADSLYTLLSPEVKKSLPQSNVSVVVDQLKSQFGNLLTSEYAEADKGITTYIAEFEKPGPVLYIHFNKDNKVVGFFVNSDKRVKTPLREGEDLISVRTSSAVIRGTISIPKAAKKIPVVLLIAGSGPTDRDGNSPLIPGKPNYFLKISDELSANDIAVLRYDKRAIGRSTSNKSAAEITLVDMVEDARALIQFLKNDDRFSEVIVCGHSEGALVGMLASQNEQVSRFISIAGPGVPVGDILSSQLKETMAPDDYKMAISVMDSIKNGQEIRQTLKNGMDVLFHPSLRPFLHSLMKFNPQAEIAKLKMPVLIIQGTHDIQVDVNNAKELKKASPNAKLVLIDGMNHILKQAPKDRQLNIATYSNEKLELHPRLISELTQFINQMTYGN